MKNIPGFILIICLLTFSCNRHNNGDNGANSHGKSTEITFNKEKWAHAEGREYPYREAMLNDLLYDDSVRMLDKGEILQLLGAPNRSNELYLYYTIDQKRLGIWPLHTKTMVIKFMENDSIDWIKIHE